MLVSLDRTLVRTEPRLTPHLKLDGRVTPRGHISNQLHLTFPTPIQSLLHPILKGHDKLERPGVQ